MEKDTTALDTSADLEAAVAAHSEARYILRLYITGTTPHSIRAIVNIRKICDEYLRGRYELDIVDIAQNPTQAEWGQIIAAPTLIKALPLPLRRFIGDMTQTEKLLIGLDLREKGAKPE